MNIRMLLGRFRRDLFGPPAKDYFPQLLTRLDDIYELLQVTHDITCVPKARGIMRMSQLANAMLLKQVTDVLHRNGIQYWLAYGTLLGAVRHRGFVPWDDDVDIGVLRSDHNVLKALLLDELENKLNLAIVKSDTMRVMLKDTPCQIDIFPFDVYNVPNTSDEGKHELECRHKESRAKFEYDFSKLRVKERTIVNMEDSDVIAVAQRLSESFSGSHKVLMVGPECVTPHYGVLDYDWFFPLKEIDYEGMSFFAPNRPDLLLESCYGTFMQYPKSIHRHADLVERFDVAAYIKLQEILSRMNVPVD